MIEPEEKLARLRGLILVRWSDASTLRVQRQVLQRRRRRRLGGVFGAAAVAILCLLLGPWLKRAARTPSPTKLRDETASFAQPLRLMDNSVASPFGAADLLRLKEDGPLRTVVEVVRGRARFDVVRRPERIFRVEAGAVSVEVLGTAFIVERGAAQVAVAVERGRVRVLWNGEQKELEAGRWQSFPPSPDPTETIGAAAPGGPSLVAPQNPTSPALALPDLRAASSRAELHRQARPASRLLQEADVARLGPNPAAAVSPLRELLSVHRGDVRAPLAAFTLGKLQLDDLEQPAAAARAFSLAQSLDPDGPLSEDALAREVEAWDKAGQASRAHERAEEYLRLYPSGTRLASVRRHGHL